MSMFEVWKTNVSASEGNGATDSKKMKSIGYHRL